jgi:hypothetical protein
MRKMPPRQHARLQLAGSDGRLSRTKRDDEQGGSDSEESITSHTHTHTHTHTHDSRLLSRFAIGMRLFRAFFKVVSVSDTSFVYTHVHDLIIIVHACVYESAQKETPIRWLLLLCMRDKHPLGHTACVNNFLPS